MSAFKSAASVHCHWIVFVESMKRNGMFGEPFFVADLEKMKKNRNSSYEVN